MPEGFKEHTLPDDDLEIHMAGNYAGVAWDLDDRGRRKGPPFIYLATLKEEEGRTYMDCGSVDAGIFSPDEADQVVKEMKRCIAYLRELLGTPAEPETVFALTTVYEVEGVSVETTQGVTDDPARVAEWEKREGHQSREFALNEVCPGDPIIGAPRTVLKPLPLTRD